MYLDKEVKKVFTTKPTISFRSARHCNDKRLVYLSTCNCCKKQYVGQTVDEFRFRWNNYKSNCRKHQRGKTCIQQRSYVHFCSSNHNCFISDVSVTFIDKTNPSEPLKKGLLEKYPENYVSLWSLY